ncbi:MAG: ABC transporter substrate-binding protein [Patescibacteria group bacterium]
MSENRQSRLVLGVPKRRLPTMAQLRYINNLLTFKQQITVLLCSVVFVAALIFMGVYRYLSTTHVIPEYGGSYVEALVGQPQYINPILAQTNDVDQDLSRLMFSGMFRQTKEQKLEPDLVTAYTISDDQLTYTFTIRQDAKWHDGEALTASDVMFTIQAIQDPNYQSPLESSLRGVQAEKVDDNTIKLTLKEPFAPFLSSLTFGILPEHIWFDAYKVSSQNITLSEYNIRPIGSGPFMFDSLVKDGSGVLKSYKLKPFKQYYGQKPYLSALSFSFYSDLDSAEQALQHKEVDGLGFITPEQKITLQNKVNNLNYYRLQLPQYTAIFFNQKKSDVLASDSVRQAMVWGVDRTTIIDQALSGEGEPIYTPILPGYLGYNTEVEKYGFDLEKGKQILEDNDWKIPEGEQYRKKGDQVLEFGIATVNQPEFLATLKVLQDNWAAMGMKVNVNVYEPADIQEQIIKPRAYEALLFGAIIGSDPDPYAFWHSTQMSHPGLALAVFYQKNIDDLLETARKTSDEEQRRLKYFNFQNILAEEIPAIFLYNPYYTYAMNNSVKGITSQYISLPSDRFVDILNWHIKTKRIKN